MALPWHWGYSGGATGDSTNDLGGFMSDPNVSIQESKAFSCDVRAGRRSSESTARIAGESAGLHVRANEDDPIAEQPKQMGER